MNTLFVKLMCWYTVKLVHFSKDGADDVHVGMVKKV